jgi:hypothetical protein
VEYVVVTTSPAMPADGLLLGLVTGVQSIE